MIVVTGVSGKPTREHITLNNNVGGQTGNTRVNKVLRLNSSHATKQQIYCFKSLNVILMKHQSLKYTTESCTGWE